MIIVVDEPAKNPKKLELDGNILRCPFLLKADVYFFERHLQVLSHPPPDGR